MRRPLGPIGQLSASLRAALEIEEEEALRGTIKIRRPKLSEEERKKSGGRFTLLPDFTIPGPYHSRPISAEGRVSFHFARDIVTRTLDGGSQIKWASGGKRLGKGAAAAHGHYIERDGAVAISPAQFDQYASRDGAKPEDVITSNSIFSNISDDAEGRADYWSAVHRNASKQNPDAIELRRRMLPADKWLEISRMVDLPRDLRDAAGELATAPVNQGHKKKHDRAIEMGSDEAAQVLKILRGRINFRTGKGQAVHHRKGRGGRVQYRLTTEFPEGLDAHGRVWVTQEFCRRLSDRGAMYVAAIHAPDEHNDERNHHLHVAYHDRPAKFLEEHGRWDFDYWVKVPNQHDRYNRPFLQPKAEIFTRDPEGGDHRKYAAAFIFQLRSEFADLCNEALEAAGQTRFFDPRSYEAMGIDRAPTKPLGPKPAALEAVGVATAVGRDNAELIWTAELQENLARCRARKKEREDKRADLRRARLNGQDLAPEAENALDRHADLSDELYHLELEEGEFQVTMAMVSSRPLKTVDTCNRILRAVENGKGRKSDRRDRALITQRRSEARDALDKLEEKVAAARPQLDDQMQRIAEIGSALSAIETELAAPPLQAEQPKNLDVPQNQTSSITAPPITEVMDHDLIQRVDEARQRAIEEFAAYLRQDVELDFAWEGNDIIPTGGEIDDWQRSWDAFREEPEIVEVLQARWDRQEAIEAQYLAKVTEERERMVRDALENGTLSATYDGKVWKFRSTDFNLIKFAREHLGSPVVKAALEEWGRRPSAKIADVPAPPSPSPAPAPERSGVGHITPAQQKWLEDRGANGIAG